MKQLEKQFSENLLLTTSSNEGQFSNLVGEYSDPPIPDDLLVDIFSRVPAKSIARFRCVSKHWASIILRPDFTELFLTKSLARPRLFFTIKADGKLFFYSIPQPRNPDDNSTLVATPYYKCFPKYFPSRGGNPVCGLVLLQGLEKRKVRVICNPATGEFLTLPKVHLEEKNLPKVKGKSNIDAKEKIEAMYLGYDPIGKQFKVLCMTSSCDKVPNSHQVLTLKSGKRFAFKKKKKSGKRLWRRIEHKFHFVKSWSIYGEICINGVLYFGADAEFGQSSMIVSFDVRTEKFSFINMPTESAYFILKLFNYKGKLGVRRQSLVFSLFCDPTKLVLWVLEDAENHKWSNHIYALSPLRKEIMEKNRFVGMTGTGEVVYWSYQSKASDPLDVFFYNLETKTFTRVNIQGFRFVDKNKKKKRFRFLVPYIDYVENVKFT